MIIEIRENTSPKVVEQIESAYEAISFRNENGKLVLVTPSSVKHLQDAHQPAVSRVIVCDSDIQLASRKYRDSTSEVNVCHSSIGGDTNHTIFISGPCSVESKEQIFEVAEKLVSLGISVIRAGCFKPRTSPYSFQGLGEEGLELLSEVRDKKGLGFITEVRDSTHADLVIEHADIVQIGAKAMYDHGILRKCGKITKPVLLKRGFGTTLKEFVQAAEFMLSAGNPNIILCERGIRTFESSTRFTLDLCGVAYLKENINLPVIVDPSHAMGYAYGVPDLARAAVAMGVDGLLLESHPNPGAAKSDAAQQLHLDTLSELLESLKRVASAVGRKIV